MGHQLRTPFLLCVLLFTLLLSMTAEWLKLYLAGTWMSDFCWDIWRALRSIEFSFDFFWVETKPPLESLFVFLAALPLGPPAASQKNQQDGCKQE